MSTDASPEPDWRDADGERLACRDKLRVLEENRVELEGIMRDAFEDAVLMGVDPASARAVLHRMVDALRSPKRP